MYIYIYGWKMWANCLAMVPLEQGGLKKRYGMVKHPAFETIVPRWLGVLPWVCQSLIMLEKQ